MFARSEDRLIVGNEVRFGIENGLIRGYTALEIVMHVLTQPIVSGMENLRLVSD